MKKLPFLAFLLATTISFAQRMNVTKGDFSILAGQKDVGIEFNYSNLKLMKENLTESQYIENRKNELNEKTRGIGDTWAKKWEGAKKGIWQPKFLELLASTATKEKDIAFVEESKSVKFTLIVDIVWIYPGWDVGIMKQPAKLSTVLRIVDAANRSNVLLEVTTENAPGDQWGNNYSNESRIGESFAKTAKSFGKMIVKELR